MKSPKTAQQIIKDLKAWNDNQPSIRKNLMNDYLIK